MAAASWQLLNPSSFFPARYDLVISDIRMPGMNGTELFLWLREAQPATARRLVFVTGRAGEKHLEAEIAQWGVPVLTKPFTIARFAETCAPSLRGTDERSASALAIHHSGLHGVF